MYSPIDEILTTWYALRVPSNDGNNVNQKKKPLFEQAREDKSLCRGLSMEASSETTKWRGTHRTEKDVRREKEKEKKKREREKKEEGRR